MVVYLFPLPSVLRKKCKIVLNLFLKNGFRGVGKPHNYLWFSVYLLFVNNHQSIFGYIAARFRAYI